MIDVIPCINCQYFKSRFIPVINHTIYGCTKKEVGPIHFSTMQSKGGLCKHKPGDQFVNN